MNDQNNKLEDKGTCSSYRRIRIQIKNQTLKLKLPVRMHPLVYFKTDKDVKRRRKKSFVFFVSAYRRHGHGPTDRHNRKGRKTIVCT